MVFTANATDRYPVYVGIDLGGRNLSVAMVYQDPEGKWTAEVERVDWTQGVGLTALTPMSVTPMIEQELTRPAGSLRTALQLGTHVFVEEPYLGNASKPVLARMVMAAAALDAFTRRGFPEGTPTLQFVNPREISVIFGLSVAPGGKPPPGLERARYQLKKRNAVDLVLASQFKYSPAGRAIMLNSKPDDLADALILACYNKPELLLTQPPKSE